MPLRRVTTSVSLRALRDGMAGERSALDMPRRRPIVIISVDVEDDFEGVGYQPFIGKRDPIRLGENTRRILDVLAAVEAKATFFFVADSVLGLPGLVRQIGRAGHEIALHGR